MFVAVEVEIPLSIKKLTELPVISSIRILRVLAWPAVLLNATSVAVAAAIVPLALRQLEPSLSFVLSLYDSMSKPVPSSHEEEIAKTLTVKSLANCSECLALNSLK